MFTLNINFVYVLNMKVFKNELKCLSNSVSLSQGALSKVASAPSRTIN